MRKSVIGVFVVFAAVLSGCAASDKSGSYEGARETRIEQLRLSTRVQDARVVLQHLITGADASIPHNLTQNATCVAVLPGVLKAAFIAGGRYGKGIATCRNSTAAWSSPFFVNLTAGSVGWQIGAQSTDLVLFFVGKEAEQALMKSNITLGGDISIAAGPVGRSAQGNTDFSKTGIYAYAASQGLFAGVSLEGSVLQADQSANREYYGESITPRSIITGDKRVTPTQDAKDFLALLP